MSLRAQIFVDGRVMSVAPLQPRHPILACADAIEAALKDVADVAPGFMPTADKAEALRRLSGLADQVSALKLRVMAVAGDVAETTADRDVATWLAVETRTDRTAQAGAQALAAALDRRWLRLGAAVGDGRVNLDQARVIAHALGDLPERNLAAEVLAKAEETLIGLADTHGPRQLRILGRRILELAAPEQYDEQEAAAIEREERRAAAATSLGLRRLGDGTTRITGRLPDRVADRLRTYLDAYTSPRHQSTGDGDSPSDRVPPRRRLGEAFGAFLEAADPARMPLHGGDATTVMITIDLDRLREQLAGVGLVGDEPISAAEARRLACTANLIPVVLDGESRVLDLGRGSRLFKPAQRKAMAVRDRRCRADGCTIPAAWCEAHHLTRPWADEGRTDLADGVLLCPWHHHRAHDDRYLHQRLPNGDLRFARRT